VWGDGGLAKVRLAASIVAAGVGSICFPASQSGSVLTDMLNRPFATRRRRNTGSPESNHHTARAAIPQD
jgi:hypothetical protein